MCRERYMSFDERTILALGNDSVQQLNKSKVAVFGVGGVGGFVCEALARAGVGHIDLIDKDVVSESNINRQIIALHSTIGLPKVEVMKARIMDINPKCQVNTYEMFYLPETAAEINFEEYDYIVDAVDTVTAKISLVEEAKRCNTPIISSMGAGNKLDPTKFRVADIYDTTVCPLAKVMRKELKNRGIDSLKVVYSTEKAVKPNRKSDAYSGKDMVIGSVSFVPSVVGLIIAGEVIKDITNINK